VSLQPINVLTPRGKQQQQRALLLVLDDVFEAPIGGQPHGQSGWIEDQLVEHDTLGNARHGRARKPAAQRIVPVVTARSAHTQTQRGKAGGPRPIPISPATTAVTAAAWWFWLLFLLKTLAQPVAGTGYYRTGQTFGDHRVTFQTGCVPLENPRSSRISRISRSSRSSRRRPPPPPAAGGSSHSIRICQHTTVSGRAGTGSCRLVPVATNAATAERGCRA
jgi:hypothetical protein